MESALYGIYALYYGIYELFLNQKTAVSMNQSVRKRVHIAFGASSIFIHRSCRISTSLLKFSRKFAKKPQTKFLLVYRFSTTTSFTKQGNV